MRNTDIENIKKFTGNLFAGKVFDDWLVTEASFSTYMNIDIDGHLNGDFLGEEEMNLPENRDGLVRWSKIKPLCFEIIKGKKVPLRFKIVFRLSSAECEKFIGSNGLNINPFEVSGLFLNIFYQDKKLYCTSGAARKSFSLDKSLEQCWDDYIERFMKTLE